MSYSWGVGPGHGRALRSSAPLHVAAGIVPVLSPGAGRRAAVPGSVAPEPTDGTERHRLANELAPMVDVWERLLEQHVPDASGRCRTCTRGGTGLPGAHWPCSIHSLAALARSYHSAPRTGRTA